MKLSVRAQNLKASPTLFLVAKAKELASKGHNVISLTVGEPDWPTFDIPSKAGIEAIEKGLTKYTAANGTLELRQLIGSQLKDEVGLPYSPKEVVVGPGAKFVLFSALQVLCGPGDEVVIPSPYWVSYPTMVELAGAFPRIVTCGEKENFKISPSQLEKSIHPNTKVFMFCSPSNPTGLMYNESELRALAEVLRRFPDVVILSDDIYNKLVFNGEKVAPHILKVAPDLRDRTIIFNGGSKAYSMTGWRIGWAAGPEKAILAMGDYQSQATGCPSSIAQHAVLSALQGCDHDIRKVVKVLMDRKEKAMSALKKIPLFKIVNPDGAFYLWVDIRNVLGKKFKGRLIETDRDFCDVLLQTFFVATVPGAESGNEGYMRLSFATSESAMEESVERMADLVGQLN